MDQAVNCDNRRLIHSAPWRLLRRLLPPLCAVCNEPGVGGRDLCERCRLALPEHGLAGSCGAAAAFSGDGMPRCGTCTLDLPPLHRVDACFSYHWPVDALLRRFKFHQDLPAGRLLSELMAERCWPLPRPQALVPISLHCQRLRQRGYDQAFELAHPLAQALQLPCRRLLKRVRATAAQSALGAPARQRNMDGAFVARVNAPLAHVTLIDDVMTTGATLQAAALALRGAGVQRVDAWVCARVT